MLFVLRVLVDVYLPKDFYGGHLEGLLAEVEAFNVLIARVLPSLSAFLQSLAESSRQPSLLDSFVLKWFSTLYVHVFSQEACLGIFDAFLCDGVEVLHRIAVGVIAQLEPSLLEHTDAFELCDHLKDVSQLLLEVAIFCPILSL